MKNSNKNYAYYKVHYIKDLRDLVNMRCEMYPDTPVFTLKHQPSILDSAVSTGKNGWYDIKPETYRNDIIKLGSGLLKIWNESNPNKDTLPRIAILSETRYEWYVSFGAVTNGLGIVIPLDRMLHADELVSMFERAEINMVIYSGKYEQIVNNIKEACPSLVAAVRMDEPKSSDNAVSSNRTYDLRTVMNMTSDYEEYKNLKINPSEVGMLLFTSGTTSKSKIVMLSQQNICSDIMSMFQMCNMCGDTFLTVLPLHHTYECTCGFLGQVFSGSTVAVGDGLSRFTNDLLLAKPTCLCIVPAILEKFYSKIEKKLNESAFKRFTFKSALSLSKFLLNFNIDIRRKLFKSIHDNFGGNLRLVFMGGAPCDSSIVKFFNDIGITVLQGYGLTECAPLIAVNRDCYHKNDSAGITAVGCEIKVFNPDLEGNGELIVKGNNVFLGYYGDEEATRAVFDSNGYFHTGDIGHIDSDGFVYITGRLKNVIIAKNGKNVFPEELEFLINKSPYICECIVSAYNDEAKNDLYIKATVFPDFEAVNDKFGYNPTEDELKSLINDEISKVNMRLENFQKIKKTELRDTEFAKSSTHKIKRYVS